MEKAQSRRQMEDAPGYGMAKTGYITLQDHGSEIWVKNIKIKTL
jgi:hypothetical protein